MHELKLVLTCHINAQKVAARSVKHILICVESYCDLFLDVLLNHFSGYWMDLYIKNMLDVVRTHFFYTQYFLFNQNM